MRHQQVLGLVRRLGTWQAPYSHSIAPGVRSPSQLYAAVPAVQWTHHPRRALSALTTSSPQASGSRSSRSKSGHRHGALFTATSLAGAATGFLLLLSHQREPLQAESPSDKTSEIENGKQLRKGPFYRLEDIKRHGADSKDGIWVSKGKLTPPVNIMFYTSFADSFNSGSLSVSFKYKARPSTILPSSSSPTLAALSF